VCNLHKDSWFLTFFCFFFFTMDAVKGRIWPPGLKFDTCGLNSCDVLLLTPLIEHPSLLCGCGGEGETSLELMSVFSQCPPKWFQLRSQLLVALTSVLVCSSSRASQDFVELLLGVVQDPGDLSGDQGVYCVRVTAWECLRELESCCPGLLTQHLELLAGLRQRESGRGHQGAVLLFALTLRNAVYHLTQDPHAGAENLRALLGANTSVAWEADQDLRTCSGSDALHSVVRGPMGSVPTLQTGPDCKELRGVVSSLLEESYLLTPLSQAALLHRLTELVAMVTAVSPALFRAQLLRLMGTFEVSLLHSTLLLKAAFTDSLFSAEDELFFLRRLLVLSQHPLLSSAHKLFYIHCVLRFPENRPISFSDDGLPVLLTPQLASVLVPTVFNDGSTLLHRLHLLSLVHLEEGEDSEESQGVAFLYQLLTALLHMVESGATTDLTVTFFRACFLFLLHFLSVERCLANLMQRLAQLYLRHAHLAQHLINLVDRVQDRLPESDWGIGLLTALQEVIVQAPPTQFSSHLKVLSRVAEEEVIPQQKTLHFLFNVVRSASSSACGRDNWRLGNEVLVVCRRLLVHGHLDRLLVPLGDILHHMTCHYGDTDIRDHARLYHALLTTLSRDKLAGVLTEGGTHVKKQTLCCLMAESEGLTRALTVHQVEGPVLRLTFSDPSFSSSFPLTFRLLHVATPTPGFDRLYSVRLHFRLTDRHYESLSDVSVPCLFRERPPPTLTLTLKPRHALPTTLYVSALFSTEDGLTWLRPLPDLHITFRQTLLPVPVPPALRLQVWEGLWEEFEGGGGMVSLFCCQLEEACLQALIQEHFLPFLVSEVSQQEVKVLHFLSPRSHVLLKLHPQEDAVHFHIATDTAQLLPYVNAYLRTITSRGHTPSSQDHAHSSQDHAHS
uniref:AP-5 complex subunit beta-1 n=1 Tax=Gouania willdenowi TaxID=441366 RepID=A0A8C5DKC3_GOUWI